MLLFGCFIFYFFSLSGELPAEIFRRVAAETKRKRDCGSSVSRREKERGTGIYM